MKFNTWHFAGIMERPGVAMVQPRENFSSHRDGDAGGRSVAEIQTNWAVHLHRNLITARRVIRRRLVHQPLTPMRRSKGTQVRQLSPRQQGKHTRIVVKAVRHQHRCCAGGHDQRIDGFLPLVGDNRPGVREARRGR